MDSLPEEVVLLIAYYLPVKDLSNCCAVSVWWREMFGGDCLWRLHCDLSLVSYLNSTEQVALPYFKKPEVDNSTLTSIGEWRLNYMKQAHLGKKWAKGCFKVTESKPTDVEKSSKNIIYNNEFILSIKNDGESFQGSMDVWNICYKAEHILTSPLVCIRSRDLDIFEVEKSDRIVVTQRCVVQVFDLNLTSAPYLRRIQLFSFETGEKCSDISDEAAVMLLKKKRGEYDHARCAVIKTFFVGMKANETTVKLHVWDIETGKKLKEIILEYNLVEASMHLNPLSFCEKTMNVVINLEEKKNDEFMAVHIHVFNLKRLAFLGFHKSFDINVVSWSAYNRRVISDYNVIILQNYIGIIVCNTLYVYNYIHSQLLFKAPTSIINHFCIMRNGFFFKCGNTYHIYEPYSTVIEFENVETDRQLFIFNNKAVEAHCTFFDFYKSSTINFAKDCLLCSSVRCILLNKSGTKLVILNHCNSIVAHFW